MAANQVKFTLKFSDDGGIELVGKRADKAAKSMDKMSDATDMILFGEWSRLDLILFGVSRNTTT